MDRSTTLAQPQAVHPRGGERHDISLPLRRRPSARTATDTDGHCYATAQTPRQPSGQYEVKSILRIRVRDLLGSYAPGGALAVWPEARWLRVSNSSFDLETGQGIFSLRGAALLSLRVVLAIHLCQLAEARLWVRQAAVRAEC